MRSNAIVELPVEIGELRNLQRLDFSYNKLSVMPTELHFLTQLTVTEKSTGERAWMMLVWN